MSVNIACSVPKCTNPVIGQCTGYKKTCGKYYCHEHSSDTHCAECGGQKAAEEHAQLVYKEYLALSEKLSREPISTPKFQFQAHTLVKIGGWSFAIGTILLIFLVLIGVIAGSLSQQISRGIVGLYTLAILGTLMLMGWAFVVIPLVWFTKRSDWIAKEKKKILFAKIKEIEKTKSGFTQFWNAWVRQLNAEQAEKDKQALMGVLAVAGAIAIAVIGATVTESEYDRTRRAVRDEINK